MPKMPSELPENERLALCAAIRESLENGENRQAEESQKMEFADLQAMAEMPYMLGDLEIPQLSHNSLSTLQHLQNPVVTGEGDVTAMDMYEFLLVLTSGPELSTKAYKHAMQLRRLKETKSLADKSPEYYEKYIAALTSITEEYFSGWQEELEAFAEKLASVGPEEISSCCQRVIDDASRVDYWAKQAAAEATNTKKKGHRIWQKIRHPFST